MFGLEGGAGEGLVDFLIRTPGSPQVNHNSGQRQYRAKNEH